MEQNHSINHLRWRLAQSLEIRWWRKYLGKKDPEAYLAWKRAYWEGFLRDLAWPETQGKRILDAGCGPAGIFILLEKNNRVEALDPLLGAYARELPHFRPGRYPNVLFREMPLEAFVPERPFDVVFCLNALNHVARLRASLAVLADCTAPEQGRLVLSVDAHRWAFLKAIFRLLPGDALHPHQHDLADYERYLLEAGMVVERKVLLKRDAIFGYWGLVCSRAKNVPSSS